MNKPNLLKAIGAGIAGTIAMTLFSAMAPMMGMPEMSAPNMLAGFMGVPVAAGWAAHFMIGTVLALSYTFLFISKLPGKPLVKGILFGLVPWLMLQVLVNPMMGAGVFALSTPAPMFMIAGSLMGHAVYGAVVGLVYGGVPQTQTATA